MDDEGDPTGTEGPPLVGAPRWAKVMGLVALALAVLLVALLAAGGGGGGHGPGRHQGGNPPASGQTGALGVVSR